MPKIRETSTPNDCEVTGRKLSGVEFTPVLVGPLAMLTY